MDRLERDVYIMNIKRIPSVICLKLLILFIIFGLLSLSGISLNVPRKKSLVLNSSRDGTLVDKTGTLQTISDMKEKMNTFQNKHQCTNKLYNSTPDTRSLLGKDGAAKIVCNHKNIAQIYKQSSGFISEGSWYLPNKSNLPKPIAFSFLKNH